MNCLNCLFFFFQAEDGIRDYKVTGVQTCALPISKQLGYSAAVTMRLAQQLYEGIEVGEEGPVGLITYMRTDSVRVADSAIAQAREYIGKEYGKRYLPDAPVMHKGGKSTARVQDAHEAIRP